MSTNSPPSYEDVVQMSKNYDPTHPPSYTQAKQVEYFANSRAELCNIDIAESDQEWRNRQAENVENEARKQFKMFFKIVIFVFLMFIVLLLFLVWAALALEGRL